MRGSLVDRNFEGNCHKIDHNFYDFEVRPEMKVNKKVWKYV